MRRWLSIPCEGEWLGAVLDDGGGPLGVLMVSGGSELACGAHGGMAAVAAALAERGAGVLRFDRKGVGDSTGEDSGFLDSAPDIAAALTTLRAECPQVTRVVATGNCDAACALLLAEAQVDALVLTNVWLDREEPEGDAPTLPPAAAIRRRYLARLASPREWWRLASGGVDLAKLGRGLRAAAGSEAPTALSDRLTTALAAIDAPVTVLLADGDATAIGFADALERAPLKSASTRLDVRPYPSRSHSFAETADREALVEAILSHRG